MSKDNANSPAVVLKEVSKHFGSKKAVDQISFSIPQGSVTAILGPNGAGKTTAISMMLGLMDPKCGSVEVLGRSPKDLKVRRKIGAMLQEVSVMDQLKAREIINLIRGYYPHPMSMEEIMALTGLTPEDLNKMAVKMSGGQKRKLGFALALAGNPELLFFDEPTVGLDTSARRLFWKTVRSLAALGKTILFTTHYLQEADDIADRIILFKDGRVAADGSPAEIKNKLTTRSVSFVAEQDTQHITARLNQVPGVTGVHLEDGRMYISADNTDQVLAVIFREELPVRDVATDTGSLDEAFEQLTQVTEEAV
ncbi:ABC transporter ATP-binding protein [Paenibacillus lemnae]|uniref:ABC transporter ATP-binding protein n=1 Tax=Paenibacillus lemnae TaxID=1330551 RepID=A0A848MA95_PAELE|nr:ABC transporter ATP-binding protein [Paenibacillus lemnae]NMO97179.1 ABC transporter ATP-binding protein [Paenibacillus lemnae]